MILDPIFISPPSAHPKDASFVVFSVAFDKEEWGDLGVEEGAVEFNPVYLGKNEFLNIRSKWKDPLYLRSFYRENEAFFKTQYWEGLTENELLSDVVASIPWIFKKIGEVFISRRLYDLFEPLSEKDAYFKQQNENNPGQHQLVRLKSKYGYIHDKIPFRIYAVEVDSECFIITGGAIKIVQEMKQAPNTNLELRKIDYLYRELQQANINTKQDLLDSLYERTE